MKSDIIKSFIGAICLLVVCMFAFEIGNINGIERETKKAIAAGVAHYEVNPTNGVTTFVYGVNTNK